MQAIQNQPPRKLHPVMWVAAVSVIVFSLVGIGAVTGLIPTSNSQPAADKQATPLVPPQLATMPRAPAEQPAAAAPAVIEEYDQLSPAAAPKPAPLSQPITPPATRSAESTPVPRKAAKPEPMRAAQAPSRIARQQCRLPSPRRLPRA